MKRFRQFGWLGLFVVGFVLSPARAEPDASPQSTAESKNSEDYYELYKIFVDTMDQVERNYVQGISRRELMEAAIKGVLDKLEDPYSNYISPKEIDHFRTSVESQFGGIGIQIAIDGGQLKVLSPLVGTPAYRAGLQAGDRILKIEGESTDGLNIDDAVVRLKGEAGTSVTLTVQHPQADEQVTVKLQREVIKVETVLGDRRKSDDSWDFLLDHENGIGYIRLTSFSRDTADVLEEALKELTGLKFRGLVLDLRFNPGGLLTSAIEISDLFISNGRIVSTEGRNSPKREWDAHAPGTYEGFPMAVLVNHYSASASEILSACLQDHKRAVVIGERSWGKGSVQNVIELEGGKSALKLTTASYLRPSGKNIHRFPEAKESDEWGVTPDEGFAVALSDSETFAIVQERRNRDILHGPRPDKAETTEPKPEGAAEENGGATEETGPAPEGDPVPEKPAESAPEGTPPAETPPAEAGAPPAENSIPNDRQLQKAVEYLLSELAKSEQARK